MRLIAISRLRNDAIRYPDVKKQIENWYMVFKNARWQNLEEVRLIYRDAEAVGNFTIFNIKNYDSQIVYYKYFLTHAEYDKGNWKNDSYF
jgi:mRNA interferase HigB